MDSTPSNRIAVIARQLCASDERPAPGGGQGTLTVLDNRSGKKYTVRTMNIKSVGHQIG